MSHKTSQNELSYKVGTAEKEITIGGIYHHWRNPDQHYKVLAVGFCEWDEELSVIYQSLGQEPLVWVRRLRGQDGWLTPVIVDGEHVARFLPVNE